VRGGVLLACMSHNLWNGYGPCGHVSCGQGTGRVRAAAAYSDRQGTSKGIKIWLLAAPEASAIAIESLWLWSEASCATQESGYPGFGAKVLMPHHDHVSLCKPESRGADAYLAVLNMVAEVAAEAVRGGSETGELRSPTAAPRR
jgi:hypothetical protein